MKKLAERNLQNRETIALGLISEVAKDKRTESISADKDRRVADMKGNGETSALPKGPTTQNAATDKQIKFMQKLGIMYPPNVTKQEANRLIKEKTGRE
jgi:hypothetical protein